MTLLAESMVGGNIIHDLGYLESGLTFSLAQLTICEEMVGWIQSFIQGVDVSEEALALDVIAEAGPEGQYLNKDHTRRHYREMWYPNLIERDDHKTWQLKGSKTMGQRAADRVASILKEHRPEPLPARVRSELKRIIQKAQTNGPGIL